VYRQYCKEDIEDIETNTKVEMVKKMEGKRSGTELKTRIIRLRLKELIAKSRNTNEVRRD